MNPKFIPLTLRQGALIAGVTLSAFFGCVSAASADVATPVSQREVRREVSSFAKLAKALKPAVVNIVVEKTVARSEGDPLDIFADLFDERGSRKPRFEPRQTGQGSGVIISADGYIMTNNHVVSNARTVKVTLSDGRELQAKVIGTDPKTDLALVKVAAKDLPFAALGDSDALDVGDWVMAIGNPFGLDATVTVGVLSGKGRVIGSGPYDDYLQTDASINPGNSGGPLFNTDGQVIGINTAIISNSQGIGFAIPVNLAKEIVQQLKVAGHVVRGYLGLGVQPLKPRLRAALKLPAATQGALVSQVSPKGPAGAAGVQVEDVVTSINGHPVRSDRDLLNQAAHLPVGKVAQVTVLRNGHETTLALNIVEHPEDKTEKKVRPVQSLRRTESSEESLGLDVAPLSADLAAELKTQDLSGVVVADVERNSAAQRAGLEPGDIIRKVNNASVGTLDDFVKIIKQEQKGGGMAFLVERQGSTRFMVIDL